MRGDRLIYDAIARLDHVWYCHHRFTSDSSVGLPSVSGFQQRQTRENPGVKPEFRAKMDVNGISLRRSSLQRIWNLAPYPGELA
jgi:hypothetical protein